MKKTGSILSLFIVTLTLLLSSCAKDGAPGPAGATGATGPTGPSGGPVGPTGPTGPSGNATVTTGFLYGLSWTSNNGYYYEDITWSAVTQDVIDSGAVYLYISNGNSVWWGLPYIWSQQNYTEQYIFSTYVGGMTLFQQCSDGILRYPWADAVKAVIVTPTQRRANPDLDFTNYEEVSSRFEVKEIPLRK